MLKLAAALVLAAVAAPAAAGVVMEFTDKPPGAAAEISKAFVAPDRVRVESGGQVIIYRGDKQVAWILDPARNTYMELTKDGVPGMAAAMKELEAQLAGMSPQERAMVESMMKGQMGGAQAPAQQPPAIAWVPNGTTDAVGGHACRGWDGTSAGRVTDQICAADWTTFGLTAADFRGLQSFADFMQGMTGPMAQARPKATLMESEIDGIPLRSISKTPQGDHVHEVTKIEKSDVAASLFELPAGAVAESMGSEPPRGAGRGRR